jgi:hypothetical protein
VRPRPVADGVGDPGADGVLYGVAAGGVEVALALDRACREAVGEQVAEAHVALVERLRVAAEKTVHSSRQLGLGAVEDEVEVGRHQAERVHRPAEALDATVEAGEEEAPVVVVAVDRAAVHAARDHVEVAVGERRTRDAGHDADESARGACAVAVRSNRRTLLTFDMSAQDVARVCPWL